MDRKLSLALSAALLSACTHTIPLDQASQTEVPGCQINVVDKRLDKNIIAIAPATTYQFPLEYPIDKAFRNTLCKTSLATQPLTVYLTVAKCSNTDGGFSTSRAFFSAGVKGYEEPFVADKNEESNSVRAGVHCGYNLDRAIEHVVMQIATSISKQQVAP